MVNQGDEIIQPCELILACANLVRLLGDLILEPPDFETDQNIAALENVARAEVYLDDAAAGAGAQDLAMGRIEDLDRSRDGPDAAGSADDEVGSGQSRPGQRRGE
jgi:hypothetical protein